MSTLQHTQQAIRSHTVLYAALAALVAAAAVTIVLVLASGGSSSSANDVPAFGNVTFEGSPAQQLEAMSGARFGITRPGAQAQTSSTPNAPARLRTELTR